MTKRFAFALSTFAVVALAAYSPQISLARQGGVPPPATTAPPVAAVHPFAVESPNGARNDDYYWLRDDKRQNPEMLAYLAAENAYTDAQMAHTKPMQELLYQELAGRIKQDDATVPVRRDGYWYYTRFAEGKEYPIYARRKGSPTAPEQVMLDGNAMAAGQSYFQIASPAVTQDGRILAYGEDLVGRRQYVLKFKNLESGETLADAIPNVSASFAWANDGRTVLYVENDPVTLLSTRVRKHVLGTDPKTDPQVYEEKDHSFYLGVRKSTSGRFLIIGLQSTVSNEEWAASADDAQLAFHVLLPRQRNHLYEAMDHGGDWIVRTNWHAPNFRLVRVRMARIADRGAWRDVVPARAHAFIHDFAVFKDYLAVGERSNALRKIRIKRWRDGRESLIAAAEPSYTAMLGDNPEQDSTTLRYVYTSLTTPRSTYDVDLATGAKTLRKQDVVLGGFDSANYVTELLWAPPRVFKSGAEGAAHAVRIPVSVVYRKGFRRGSGAPLLQTGYGSYGLSTDPVFNASALSLLDRGFVYAIAHIRGGQELGRAWYDDGKLLHKKNTFNDFVDVTRFLVAQGYAAEDKVFALGGSAGGLLMGAVVNQCPDCYRGVIANVPFVDVVTTMLDESIPLTTNEFDEWGNPKEKRYYDYMLSYSPYDNVERKAYPAMIVSSGLWDSQVQYYEPTKWVAKLRARKTDAKPLFFHVNMEAGHGGKSGRFQRLHDTALYDAFLFDQLGRDLAAEAKTPGSPAGAPTAH
jgi:oligopeptidase B